MSSYLQNPAVIILLCLTLGLAPFQPEPHIVGKIRWILGGANGMGLMDWLDFLFHGLPWFLLGRLLLMKAVQLKKKVQ